MYYTDAALFDMATPVGNGYHRVTVTLAPGDTAYAPGTTKYALTGAGDYTYLLSDMGDCVESAPAGHHRTLLPRS